MSARRYCLYSPADLNLVSGSSIWVQAVAEVLHADEAADVFLPLRSPERRGLITDALRRLPRLTLVDPRRQDPYVPPSGLYPAQALDLIEALDREAPFDAIILRSFPYCLAAIDRPALRGRIWSTYVLEPERDPGDPEYVRDLSRIAAGSRHLVVQSEGMRALLEGAVPAARGRTIILPPAVPPAGAPGVPERLAPPAPRMAYAGKFHPFYPVPAMIDALETLRPAVPGLEFHVLGDQVARPPGFETWADDLERRLVTTPGVVWHGAVARDEAIRILNEGGVALSLWEYRHGSRMNDLVVSTKLLDYCLAGVPVVLNRTAAQEEILGADYPLFVRSADEAVGRLRSVLADPDLHRAAAARCRAAIEPFRYPAVAASLAPFLEARDDTRVRMAARPKLAGAGLRAGLPLDAEATDTLADVLAVVGPILAAGRDRHLVVGLPAAPSTPDPIPGRDPAARFRAAIPDGLEDRISLRTITDPLNWWRGLGALYAPGGTLLDPTLEGIGRDSGARVAHGPDELAAAFVAADPPTTSAPEVRQ